MTASPLTKATGPTTRTHRSPDTRPVAPSTQEPIEPGLLRVEVDPDAIYVAGRLNARDTATAARILAYLRDHGVLVTASAESILLVIARPIAPALLDRITANAALLRAALACPQCGRRHSLSPPYGWCWPCAEDARHGERGPCAFGKPGDSVPESIDSGRSSGEED